MLVLFVMRALWNMPQQIRIECALIVGETSVGTGACGFVFYFWYMHYGTCHSQMELSAPQLLLHWVLVSMNVLFCVLFLMHMLLNVLQANEIEWALIVAAAGPGADAPAVFLSMCLETCHSQMKLSVHRLLLRWVLVLMHVLFCFISGTCTIEHVAANYKWACNNCSYNSCW